MTALTYNVLDANAKGPAQEIQQGGLVLTYDTNGVSTARMTRGTIGRKTGIWSFEAVFYGDNSASTGCLVGVVLPAASLSNFPGGDVNGWGFSPSDGKVYNNNAVVATVNPVAPKKTITVEYNGDVSPPTCTWYVNGSPVVSVNLPTGGKVFYPAMTVSGTKAYDTFGFMNCGQRTMQFPLPSSIGWYSATTTYNNLYLCSNEDGAYMSAPTDSPANQAFLPRIMNAKEFKITRRTSVWQWKGRSVGTSFSTLTLDNWDGVYDWLLSADIRDTLVRVSVLPRGAALASKTVVATGILDKVMTIGEDKIELTLRSTLSRLQKPIQKMLFPPYVDAGVANRQVPLTYGACRNVPVGKYLYDSPNRLYQLSSGAITNIARLRDMGAPLDATASPPQYTPTSDLRGIQLATLPVGVLTADVSSEGPQVVVPGALDVLGGIGKFTTWTAGVPNGWTKGGSVTGGSGITQGSWPGVAGSTISMVSDKPFSPTQTGNPQGVWVKTSSNLLKQGRSYRVTLKILQMSGTGGYYTTSMDYGLVLASAINTTLNTPADWITPYRQPVEVPFASSQTYTFSYTVPAGSDRPLYLIMSSSEGITIGSGNGACGGVAAEIYVEELAGQTQSLPLTGITFLDYYTAILQTLGGLTPAQWSSDDADGIDSSTGYLFGVHIGDAKTVEDAARMPVDSIDGALFDDADGVVRIRRLVDPYYPGAVNNTVAFFGTSNVKAPVQVTQDLAQGLTTTFGARRNWYVFQESDFVTDYGVVPAALRTQFKRQSQFIVTSTRSLATTYQHAVTAAEMNSLLDDPVQAQAEDDRVCFSYSTARTIGVPRFVQFTYLFRPEDGIVQLYFGDVVQLTYPRFGFDNGRYLVVVDTELMPYYMQCTLTCWG